MAQQKIILASGSGADSRRVLDVVTPINAAGAPAVNAKFLGQLYIDETNDAVYVAIAVGSVVKADDWIKMVPASIIMPMFGAAAPAVNAAFLGQLYIETTTPAVYVAIKVDDATPANDWQRIDAYDA